jgi:Heparinase II/III-like protein/Heparinase II/III N-terminus
MRLRHAWNLVQQMGPAWVAYRAGYALQKRLGWFERRFPVRDWSAYRLTELVLGTTPEQLLTRLREDSAPRFFFPDRERRRARLAEVVPDAERDELGREVAEASAGKYRFFSGDFCETGWPPRWHRHPHTGDEWPRDHWSRLPDLPGSDVKWVWELGRFGLAYGLVRASWLTGDPQPAEMFWELVAAWRAENPPNCGAQWMCGQECAVRVLAWCFALFAFLDDPATRPERVAGLVEMLAAHGDRIAGNLRYAVSQKNNHAVNEALALWTLGTLFPFLPRAAAWERIGRRTLEREARRQIYADGAYVQHSLNYHRLMLQAYAWALRLGDLSDRPFSDALRDRYGRAVRFLYELTDLASGKAPNYGANDGGVLWRLDACPFADQRPTLALAFWVAEGKRPFARGPWDEPLLWFCGDEPLRAATEPLVQTDLSAEAGGYYTLRGEEAWAFTRCAAYRDRPAQADMLHVDLWWRGANVLADPGTYSYASPPPWNNGLAATAAHNTVTVDGLDQMERGPRFTWFHWNRGRVLHHGTELDGRVKYWEGQHDGYRRALGVTHRRAVFLIGSKLWVLVDELTGEGTHELSGQWLFPEADLMGQQPNGLRLSLPPGEVEITYALCGAGRDAAGPRLRVVRGCPDSTRGWFSERYLAKKAALAAVVEHRSALPIRQVTTVALADVAVESLDETGLTVDVGAGRLTLRWAALPCPADRPLLTAVRPAVAAERVGRPS